jgi:long-subunit fatty acid transport protein
MRFLSTSLLLLTTLALWAQPKQNSPYSRFGLGDLLPQTFAHQSAMGGQSAAFHDPFHLNVQNPASFSFLRATALETALYAKYGHLESGGATKDNWTGNLAYLSLGFTLKSPINEVLDRTKSPWKFGMGFTLAPYTLVGYNIETVDTLPDIGIVNTNFTGSGGSYRLQWSNAARYKNTGFGATLGWVFGKALYENVTVFADTLLPTFQNNIREDIGLNGFVWNVGVQHDLVLKHAPNDKELATRWVTFGLTAESNHRLRTITDRFFIRSRGRAATGQYINADTLVRTSDLRQNLTLPAAFSLGVQIVEADKYRLGAQLGYETWSGYENEARPERLRNTFSVSAGMEFIPDYASYNRYWKRIRYRLGGYYRQDPRSVGGQGIDDLGLSFGFGLPIVLPRQQTSFVNMAFELGRFGAKSPVEESYFRITAGFTLNDNSWFYKRRFE